MSKHQSHTLRQRLVVPILAIVIVQAVLYGFVFIRMNVVSKIDHNAYEMLYQHTSGSAIRFENEMVHRWSNLDQFRVTVLQNIEDSLATREKTVDDLKDDAILAQEVVADTAHNAINLLRTNMVTGAFLVLDAPGLANDIDGTTRAGVYIRDLDPAAYAVDNSDLLLERAMPMLTKTLHLPLDSNWSSVFTFQGDGSHDERFFFESLQAAQAATTDAPSSFGYWSPMFTLPGNNCNIITYSQPLIASDGTVLGVIGIDLTEKYLRSQFDAGELGLGRYGSYLLGTLDGDSFLPMLSSGSYLEVSQNALTLSEIPESGLYEIVDGAEDSLVCLSPIQLYDANSPFADENWVVASIVSREHLLSFSHEMRTATYFSILLSLLCAIIALFIIGRSLTKPIIQLANDLKTSDPTKPLHLPVLQIDEIDRLSGAIVDLSSAVAASASKFSEIIRLTGLPVGVFEHTNDAPSAFCSRTLCHLLGWPEACDCDISLPIAEFNRRMEQLQSFRCASEEGFLYHLPEASGLDSRWLRMVRLQRNDGLIGSVSDVTAETLEKQKIEYERDYDLLSRLFNRRAFEREIDALFLKPEQLKISALVMWDLDNLKYLNDTYGHDCGDQYIAAFSSILMNVSFKNYLTARRSGDEFYAFFYGYSSRERLREDINQLYRQICIASLMLPSGDRYRMRASGGIAYYPQDAQTPHELIYYADFAMYSIKHSVKGNLGEFDRTQYEQNGLLLRGQDALDRLLDQELVRYALHPIFDVHELRVFGYELLMRPQLEDLPSVGDVLRLARSHSKMRQIEHMSLFKGMETFARLDSDGKLAPNAKVFINSVASQRLDDQDEAEFFKRFAAYFPRLVLELTENDPYDMDITRHKIERIVSLNGEIALDDYGSGYNGDSVLLFLSPHYIKVDLSIIRNIHKDPNRQSVFNYLISYAKPRGIRVLAEGVESIEEIEYVVSHGVDLLQGYFIARPSFEPEPIPSQVVDAIRRAKEKSM